MPDKNICSIYKEQKQVRPKPEDVAGAFLDPERASAMLGFVAFLRENKINIQWGSGNSWTLNYKGKRLGYLKIYTGILGKPALPHLDKSWFFCHNRLFLDRYYTMEDSPLKTFVFDNIYARNCGNCLLTNAIPNEQKAGYMNPTGCGCFPLRIFNADSEALEYTQQLVSFRMKCIVESKL